MWQFVMAFIAGNVKIGWFSFSITSKKKQAFKLLEMLLFLK